MRNLFVKHPGNPLLTCDDFPSDVMYVLNPGAIRTGEEYVLVCDAALGSTRIVPWVARSRDGITFTPDPEPARWPEDTPEESLAYDPRITRFGDDYILMYAAHHFTGENPSVGVVKTRDFRTFERIPQAPAPCPNRNAVLFPEKIGGRFVRFDRPMRNGETGAAGMCLSFSDDLMHWEGTVELMQPRPCCWDSHKIGGAAVPLKTRAGWLTVYHGVDNYSCNNYIYRLGVMLLDLEDPSRILARSTLPVLYPDRPYEFIGRTPNVVFSCNLLADGDGNLRMYYGVADTCIALAESRVDKLLDFCIRHG